MLRRYGVMLLRDAKVSLLRCPFCHSIAHPSEATLAHVRSQSNVEDTNRKTITMRIIIA